MQQTSRDQHPKTLIDYTFVFASGDPLPVTIDPAIDKVTETEDGLIFALAPCPSILDPTVEVPGRLFTVFLKNVNWWGMAAREFQPPTPEQKAELMKMLKFNT